jgi:hypothetical protein
MIDGAVGLGWAVGLGSEDEHMSHQGIPSPVDHNHGGATRRLIHAEACGIDRNDAMMVPPDRRGRGLGSR